MPKPPPQSDSTSREPDSWCDLPVAVIHPSELASLANMLPDAATPAAVSLRTPKLIADYSLVLANSMRVSRNSLINALLARSIHELITRQTLPIDVLPLTAYFDPAVEIPNLRKPKQ
jgi:hypothetical protein